MTLIDQRARTQALDATRSFIVQAPAGSGKTELLTQRYLNLLSKVERYPEQVLAITFTRKAAAEMRSRIYSCLEQAQRQPMPEEAHKQTTWKLAKAVLERDLESGWGLMENPNRLSVQTIDSLCAGLMGRLPILSQAGSKAAIVDNANLCYQEAATELLNDALWSDVPWRDAVQLLLGHLDNRVELASGLLAKLLAARDQWLEHCMSAKNHSNLRQSLEANLQAVVEEQLVFTHGLLVDPVVKPRGDGSAQDGGLDGQFVSELMTLARFAAEQLRVLGKAQDSPIGDCLDLTVLPEPTAENLPIYLGLAELMLTKDGRIRAQVTKAIGFPAASAGANKEEQLLFKEMKRRLQELLKQQADNTELLQALAQLRQLPATTYSDTQWQLLDALLDLLPIAAAKLQLVFQKLNKIDFIEVSLRALQALGDPSEPTDLALTLDYRYQHLLIDEFQDTSVTQWQLLERLTAGWEPHDGRTLFLVGDPMQSIYRFRQAEVGLFLRARQQGIGNVALEPLNLLANFRSSAKIVHWANQSFSQIFPQQEHIASGAVTYEQATSTHAEFGLGIDVIPTTSPEMEAVEVAGIVKQAIHDTPNQSIAILVRSRSHLSAIVPALQLAGVVYQAVDIDPIASKPLIQDCLMLGRALMHLGDRVAWLAVVRAPWLGFTLPTLTELANVDEQLSLWGALNHPEFIAALSPEQTLRLQRFNAIIESVLAKRGKRSFTNMVEQAWVELGGRLLEQSHQDALDVRTFFACLRQAETQGVLTAGAEFVEAFAGVFAKQDATQQATVQLMTIHKSKGLEFDTVIIPSLGRRQPIDEHQLLTWFEQPDLDHYAQADAMTSTEDTRAPLILAPIATSATEPSKIYDYVRSQQKRQADNETVRVLYVAVTRAKSNLYLLGGVKEASAEGEGSGVGKPAPGSLLSLLWPCVERDFVGESADGEKSKIGNGNVIVNGNGNVIVNGNGNGNVIVNGNDYVDKGEGNGESHLLQIATNALPEPKHKLPHKKNKQTNPVGAEHYVWQHPAAKHLGTLLHRIMVQLAKEGIETYQQRDIVQLKIAWRQQLLFLGVLPLQCEPLIDRLLVAMNKIYQSKIADWIISPQHSEAECEYALVAVKGGQVLQGVVDRTFIDDSGIRWIVDYKMSEPKEGVALSDFLAQQRQQYQAQLERYAELLASKGEQSIKLMLYFPLIDSEVSWTYQQSLSDVAAQP